MAGAELARYIQGQKIDGFWLACGAVALIAGALEHAHLSWRLAPIMLILLGAGVLLNVTSGPAAFDRLTELCSWRYFSRRAAVPT